MNLYYPNLCYKGTALLIISCYIFTGTLAQFVNVPGNSTIYTMKTLSMYETVWAGTELMTPVTKQRKKRPSKRAILGFLQGSPVNR